jgi:hypothetical protein
MSRFAHVHTPLLADSPPECVLAEVDAAWERAQDLVAGELELSFALGSVAGRLRCELRTVEGEIWERLTATEALALACGDAALALAA